MNNGSFQDYFRFFNHFIKAYHGIELYPFQLKIDEAILKAVFYNQGGEIPIQVSRQAGKTEGLVRAIEFLLITAPEFLGRRLRIGIFAPQKGQATTDFDRLKDALLEVKRKGGLGDTLDDEKSNASTLQLKNGCWCYIFPLTKTSFPESKTLDLIVYEEANKVNDKLREDVSDPMGTATNAPRIHIGVGGYKRNHFIKLIETSAQLIQLNYEQVSKEKKQAYRATKDDWHLNYVNYIDEKKKELGVDDPSFRTQYKLETVLGSGQFCTPEAFESLRVFNKRATKDLIAILEIKGTNYLDQAEIIVDWLLKLEKIAQPLYVGIDQGKHHDPTAVIVLRGFEKGQGVQKIAIDATGTQDFMPDWFERNTSWDIIHYKFTATGKDALYKNFNVAIENKLTLLPSFDTSEILKLKEQMLDLETTHRGELTLVHHPDKPDAHDDLPDGWALAETAYIQAQRDIEPGITWLD